MRSIKRIYVHCTASEWGTVEEITRWHLERGFKTIGYHGLITNIFPTYASFKDGQGKAAYDGKFWPGRSEDIAGAHVKGDNANTLGYALVGNEAFSQKQIQALVELCAKKCIEYGLEPKMVWGHREYWENRGEPAQKSCPNLQMDSIRQMVESRYSEIQAQESRAQGQLPSRSPFPLCCSPDPRGI